MILPPMRLICSSLLVIALADCHSSDATGPGGTTLPPGLTLKLNPFVTSGLTSPVFLTQPLNDGRMFVVEKAGTIRAIRDGLLQPKPFLDITARVQSTTTEQGLFSGRQAPDVADSLNRKH